MPSFEKVAARRFNAMERLNGAKEKLTAKIGVEVIDPKVRTNDPDFRHVLQLEAFADTLEGILAKLDEMQVGAAESKSSTKRTNSKTKSTPQGE